MIRSYSPIALLFFITICAQGQTFSLDKIYSTYDELVGLDNTDFYNGTEFTDLYLNTNGTYRYLDGFDYSKGSIVYKDQYYVDVMLKYDVLEDQLLTKSNDNLSIFNVKLITEFISEFNLNGRHFVKVTDFGDNGFFEWGYQGKAINLYIKHKKTKTKRVLKSGIQYGFKPLNFYLFEYQGKYYEVETIGNVRRAFPEFKSEVNDFYHSFKALYKNDRDAFMKKLASYMDNLPKNKF